jgi:hypothetical protein
MSRKSTLEKIKVAIKNGCLTEPFNVSDVQKVVQILVFKACCNHVKESRM